MLLETRHFGEIEVDESGIIEFKEGLPGFENVRKFVLLCDAAEGEDSPFKWLQGVDKPELAFVVVDPFLIKKDYDIEINDEVCKRLDIEKVQDVKLYSIVVVPDDPAKISMNLKAPVVINVENKKGAQVVLDTDMYGVRHYILDELRGQEDMVDACTDKKEEPVYNYK